MNIDKTQNLQQTQIQTQPKTSSPSQQENDVKFANELNELKEKKDSTETQDNNKITKHENNEEKLQNKTDEKNKSEEDINDLSKQKLQNEDYKSSDNDAADAIDGLTDVVNKINQLNRVDENFDSSVKKYGIADDKRDEYEDTTLIDNNMNIKEPKEKLTADIGTSMNFNSDSQPFSKFIAQTDKKNILNSSVKEIAEENEILSTMEENLSIANKNMAIKNQEKTKTVTNEEGIKKVDTNTNITVDTIVQYDSIIMNKSDVEFFAQIANGAELDLRDIQNTEKSVKASKTLADLLAKSMQDNKPLRIDFDNNISVIIKISRDGKISADFLPSSQVAEAYLKENLPLLRQRFDDNNIDYGELNQRRQKQDDSNDNRRKGRKDE